MTQSELKEKELRDKKEIAAEDRAQKERSDKRSAKASFYGNALKGITGMLGKINDPKWYRQVPGMDAVTCSIPDFTLLGTNDAQVYQNFGDVDINVPAVVRINYGPTIGNWAQKIVGTNVFNMQRGEDAFNRGLNFVATKLENRNSRVLSYSRDTIGRYIFIVTDIANDLVNLKACIDVFDKYSLTKPFLARQIIRSKGFNYSDFKSNISAFRESYVQWANDFNAGLPLPSELTFTKRQLWLANTIAMDSKTDYHTCLTFNKAVRFEFGDLVTGYLSSDVYAGCMPYTSGYSYVQFVNHIANKLEGLIQGATWKPLIRDLRGGTKSNMWLTLPNDITKKTVNFTDVDEVRLQIHNMSSIPCVADSVSQGVAQGFVPEAFTVYGTSSESVAQNLRGYLRPGSKLEIPANSILPGSQLIVLGSSTLTAFETRLSKYTCIASWAAQQPCSKHHVLSCFADKLTADDFLVATRFKTTFRAMASSVAIASGDVGWSFTDEVGNVTVSNVGTYYYGWVVPVQYGTEIIISTEILYDKVDTATPTIEPHTASYMLSVNYTLADGNNYALVASTDYLYEQSSVNFLFGFSVLAHGNLTTIDWFPLTSVELYNFSDNTTHYRVFGELDHYTLLGVAELGKLHDQCIESEAYIPDNNFLPPLS